MTIIYRSPDLIIDDNEWHLCVRRHMGRTALQFYFRPLASARLAWRPIHDWRGRLPSFQRFQTYRLHGRLAMEGEAKRAGIILERERLRREVAA